MAIEKVLGPLEIAEDDPDFGEDVVVEADRSDVVIIEEDDGSVVIDFDGGSEDGAGEAMEHNANLAEYIEDTDLSLMASELIQEFTNDRRSREDWAKAYVKGLDLLGMKVEDRTVPWPGAAGVFHPVMTEAVVSFQAQAMSELYPATGPARTKILASQTSEMSKQAQRVENELNYQITEEMTEYRDEMEQLLFRTALAGSGFKKIYYDPIYERPCAMFVPAEDMVVGYGATDLRRCDRYTHVMKKTQNEVTELQIAGFYAGVELPKPSHEITDIEEKYNEIMGEEEVANDDDRHTILEMNVNTVMPEGFDDDDPIARPYVITIEKSARKILAIRRNWEEGDPKKKKMMHFVHYKYLPGLGFYGLGLVHLLGGLAKSATSILRQLIDAGTLSNLSAGFKAKGMRITGDNSPLRPGEWRDVDVPGGAIRDALFPVPYKEPSGVLYNLLGNIVDEARRIGSIADIDVGNMSAQAPVGTTLAMLERSLKVMSGVQARMHSALRQELRLLARVIHDYMGPEYAYDPKGEFDRQKDFDGRVDVIPVSDPNASTMAQRVVQYQTALQLATQSPQIYDIGKLHRQMLEVLNIQNAAEIIKLPEDMKPIDPVAENMAVLKQEPVRVFEYQDHEAHIAVHMAASTDPKIQQIVGQSPFASAIQASMAAHITEHVAMQYRVEIQKELGVQLPSSDEDMPQDVEREVSRLSAEAADKLLKRNEAEAAKEQADKVENDPLTQIQRKELEIKERAQALKEKEAAHDAVLDLENSQVERMKVAGKLNADKERMDAENRRNAASIAARLATQLDSNQSKEKLEGAKMGFEMAKEMMREANDGRSGNAKDKDS